MAAWMPIEGYGNAYSVSDEGDIARTSPRNLPHRKCDPWINFKPSKVSSYTNKGGYRQVRIGPSGAQKTVCVHILVARSFVRNPFGLPEVNHKDGDKLNNSASNLEWVTRSENMKHAIQTGLQAVMKGEQHGMSKLSNESVKDIRTSAGNAKQLSAKYNVSLSLIYLVRQKKIWKDI